MCVFDIYGHQNNDKKPNVVKGIIKNQKYFIDQKIFLDHVVMCFMLQFFI